MTNKNQAATASKQQSQRSKDLGLVGIAQKPGASGNDWRTKQDAVKLAEFVSSLDVAVPDIKGLLKNMRQAASYGLSLPKGLRTYKRPDGDYGVISSKADLNDSDKFARSCAFRKRYEVSSEDGLFQTYGVWDFEMQAKSGKWVAPSWTTSVRDRREHAILRTLSVAKHVDEVASFEA